MDYARRFQTLTLLIVLVLTAFRASAAEFFEKSYALVVGIDRYAAPRWSSLGYAVKDAQAMESYLRTQGFDVTALYDEQATRSNIVSKMSDELAPKLRKRDEGYRGDRVLVFFAGHGDTKSLGGQDWGYIVPHDGTDKTASYISLERLRSLSEEMGNARHQLFIMDACYGGHLITRGVVSLVDLEHPSYVQETTDREARQIITAGGEGQQVVDHGPNGHSVFTGYLLEALRGAADLNGDGYIFAPEIQAYLQPRATNRYQTPAFGYLPGHAGGEFVFRNFEVAASNLEAPSTERSGDSENERVFWSSIKDSDNPEYFEAYLRRYPNGDFVALARIRSGELVSTPPASGESSSTTLRGTIVVQSTPPGKAVFLDGREVGSTPTTIPDVEPGQHVVRVDRGRFPPMEREVRVEPGQEQLVVARISAEEWHGCGDGSTLGDSVDGVRVVSQSSNQAIIEVTYRYNPQHTQPAGIRTGEVSLSAYVLDENEQGTAGAYDTVPLLSSSGTVQTRVYWDQSVGNGYVFVFMSETHAPPDRPRFLAQPFACRRLPFTPSP